MKKYTQEEYDAIERDEHGYKNCPTGDYTQIKTFEKRSIFGNGSIFVDGSSFGEGSSFGARSRFGAGSSFGAGSIFGDWSSFGKGSIFVDGSSFGEGSSFGDGSSFGEGCKIEGDHEFTDFLKFDGFGSSKRCTYFWLLVDKTVYVRCGCFAGALEAWIEKVKETHGDNKFGQDYLKIAELVKLHWGIEDEDK